MTQATLPPVERSVSVSWNQETAFRRFTHEFASWWPWQTHSIGGKRIKRLVFEPEVGGRIFEEHIDGRRFQWGRVLEWEPPRRVKFTFHPARDPATAQDVEVSFVPEGTGTRARRGYHAGWGYVLNVWAGRRPASMVLLRGVIEAMRVVEWFRGGTTAAIARAGGEIPSA